jgi:glycosyltransferase involved in cell wall biosynthesis
LDTAGDRKWQKQGKEDMRVIYWNLSKKVHPVTGIIRYEDELFENIRALRRDLEIERIQRVDNKILGSVLASWFWRYRCKGADIVHATFPTAVPAANFRRPRGLIVTVHDLAPTVYPPRYTKQVLWSFQWMFVPTALRKVDRIIAISEFTKKEVVRLTGIEESKIDVVHQGVDHSRYRPMDKEECKKRFDFGIKEKHILVVASNHQRKRMDVTQRVFDEVRKQRKNTKLIKAGYAKTLIGEDIINTGYVPESEMPILYNAADVFLHTSEYEGFGFPILEAMSCGVPVVVSNKASIPEVVGSYGNTVDLDSEDVIEQFAAKILSCLDKGIDEEAVNQSQNFSWAKTAAETVKVYERVYSE